MSFIYATCVWQFQQIIIYWINDRPAEIMCPFNLQIPYPILRLLWVLVCFHRSVNHGRACVVYMVLFSSYKMQSSLLNTNVPIKLSSIGFTSHATVTWRRNGHVFRLRGSEMGSNSKFSSYSQDPLKFRRREPRLTFRCQYLHVIRQVCVRVCACVCARMIVLWTPQAYQKKKKKFSFHILAEIFRADCLYNAVIAVMHT